MRNGTIDYARFLAACGIVLFHSGAPGGAIGYAGLPFFLILLASFGLPPRTLRSLGLAAYFRTRAIRLLLPWLGWSVIYASAKLAEVSLTGKPLTSEFAPWMLFTGPGLHLWFLPFAFVGSLVLWAVAPLHDKTLSQTSGDILSLIFAVLALGLPIFVPFGAFLPPLTQYLFALPGFCLGLAFAFQTRMMPKWAIMAVLSVALWWAGLPGGGLQLIIAGWAVLLCFSFPMQGSATSQMAAGLSLTVYLMHPLVLSFTARALHLPTKGLAIGLVGLAVTLLLAVLLHLTLRHQHPTALARRVLGV